jgi:myo-inositol-1(or 4)-monophosphatase
MNDFWQSVLDFCQQTSRGVGKSLSKDFGQISATRKADGTLVTQADRASDQAIQEAIRAWFPNHGILTEETEHIFPANQWCWIVDPIDGTTNFTRGIPIWGISLGLLYNGIPVFGYVYFPMFDTAYYGYYYGNSGLKGPEGAYCNGNSITTSQDSPSQNHIFNICARSTHIMTKPFPCKIRLIGVASYNIALVATGAALGGLEATPKVWDIAAVWVILQAAGGIFHSLEEKPIFPLKVGKNYKDRPFPCLTSASQDLLFAFLPLVKP